MDIIQNFRFFHVHFKTYSLREITEAIEYWLIVQKPKNVYHISVAPPASLFGAVDWVSSSDTADGLT